MKQDDAQMLQEIQKNTSMALKAIATVSEYVHDASFARELHGQSRVLQNIRNRAVDRLLEEREEIHQNSVINELLLSGNIHVNTLVNTSTARIAEVMIRGNQRGMTGIWKAMNHFGNAGKETVELAKELTDFETECIEKMRSYL